MLHSRIKRQVRSCSNIIDLLKEVSLEDKKKQKNQTTEEEPEKFSTLTEYLCQFITGWNKHRDIALPLI